MPNDWRQAAVKELWLEKPTSSAGGSDRASPSASLQARDASAARRDTHAASTQPLGVEVPWIREHFEHGSYRLPSEIAFADDTYSMDVTYPRRIEPSGFALAAVAYASLDNSSLLDDPLTKREA